MAKSNKSCIHFYGAGHLRKSKLSGAHEKVYSIFFAHVPLGALYISISYHLKYTINIGLLSQ